MNLLARADRKIIELREQGLTECADRLAESVAKVRAAIGDDEEVGEHGEVLTAEEAGTRVA